MSKNLVSQVLSAIDETDTSLINPVCNQIPAVVSITGLLIRIIVKTEERSHSVRTDVGSFFNDLIKDF